MSRVITIAAIFGVLSLGHTVTAQETETAAPLPVAKSSGPAPGVSMNNHYLDVALRSMTDDIEGDEGQWVLTWFDVEMLVIADETSDRMRVMAIVAEAEELDREQFKFLLEVNFERALDAKYTIWQDQIWATFVHPLSWLTPDELKAGARQVVSLVHTYGTDFTSTGISFATGLGDPADAPGGGEIKPPDPDPNP